MCVHKKVAMLSNKSNETNQHYTRTHKCREQSHSLPHKHNVFVHRAHIHAIVGRPLTRTHTGKSARTHRCVKFVNTEIRNVALRRCHRGLSSLADGNLLSIPSNVYTDANTDAHTHAHAHKCVAVFCWHSQVNRQIHTHSQLQCSNVLDAYVYDSIHCTAC